MRASQGLPPVARPDARILVLGSLPGARSIAVQQYYAHPRNAFWPIMRELYGVDGDYATRCGQLVAHGIALWDVLQSSVRPGSLDAAIRVGSARANDFASFLQAHRDIRLIGFNGGKAEQLFGRFVTDDVLPDTIARRRLPSTSPAYAALPFSGKLSAWRAALGRGEDASRRRT